MQNEAIGFDSLRFEEGEGSVIHALDRPPGWLPRQRIRHNRRVCGDQTRDAFENEPLGLGASTAATHLYSFTWLGDHHGVNDASAIGSGVH